MASTTSLPGPLSVRPKAEAAFHQGDPGPRMAMWSRRDPVTLSGAAGMYTSGWDEPVRIFPWVASRFSNVSDYRFDVLVADVSGDLAYSVGYERLQGIDRRPSRPADDGSRHARLSPRARRMEDRPSPRRQPASRSQPGDGGIDAVGSGGGDSAAEDILGQ